MENNSRRKVLLMLQDGKITVDEAAALLEKLTDEEKAPPSGETGVQERKGRKPRFLRVLVDSSDGDKVSVKVPLSLIKTGIKLTALIPDNAKEKMSDSGFDLSQLSELNTDELIEALSDLEVDIDSEDGDKVRVFTE